MAARQKKYILIAEDDANYAHIFQLKLSKEGYEVCVAGNGEEVLKIARSSKPDLILLDLVMPIKNGFEVLKEIKEDAHLRSLKVIVVSNLGQEEDIAKVRSYGVERYFIKADISIYEVVDAIKNYLHKYK